MSAQPSELSASNTSYVDEQDKVRRSRGDADQQPGAAAEISPSQKLLQQVLGETLVRQREDSGKLVDALRGFYEQHSNHPCDETLFVLITREVLRHRLGERSADMPAELFDEVGRALWSNDQSRQRVRRFWETLGAQA